MKIIALLLSTTLALLVGCIATTNPTNAGKSASTKQGGTTTAPTDPVINVRLSYPPTLGTIDPPTAAEIAASFASTFPSRSTFGPLRDGKSEYSQISITSRGAVESGLLYTNISGVAASASNNTIEIKYTKGKRKTQSPSVYSITTATVTIQSNPSEKNSFVLTVSPIKEELGREMLFFPLSPLAPKNEILEDISSALKSIKPTISRSISHEIEVDSPYPPAAIYANFQRAYGNPTRENHAADTRSGNFNIPLSNGSILTTRIIVSPFRTGSKIVARYSSAVKLSPDAKQAEIESTDGLETDIRRIVSQ